MHWPFISADLYCSVMDFPQTILRLVKGSILPDPQLTTEIKEALHIILTFCQHSNSCFGSYCGSGRQSRADKAIESDSTLLLFYALGAKDGVP